MANQTKAQRIEAKVDSGLSHIEAEIEVEQEDAAARIARLRQRKEKEDAKVREIVVDLLEEDHSEVFDRLQAKARERLGGEAQRRRERAKRVTRSPRVTAPVAEETEQSAHSTEACGRGSGGVEGRAQPSPASSFEEDERQRCLTKRLLAPHVSG